MAATSKELTRESGTELLRILLMLMIITHHLIVHGAKLELLGSNSFSIDSRTNPYLFLNSFFVIGVDGFIFISGFYGINYKLKGLVNIILQVVFYSLVLLVLSKFISHSHIGVRALMSNVFPIMTGRWWFITAYIFLYIFSPILNAAIAQLSKQKFGFIIIAWTVMICVSGFIFDPSVLGVHNGYSLNSMLYIYLLGRYINKYVNTTKFESNAVYSYIFFSLIIFACAFLSLKYAGQILAWKVFAYNNPLILLSSISFFFIFKRMKFRNAAVNAIAVGVLGVYLLHSNSFTAGYIYRVAFVSIQHFNITIHFILMILLACVVFSVCLAIEYVRAKLFKPVAELITQSLESKFRLEG